jgi:hypothetical protein
MRSILWGYFFLFLISTCPAQLTKADFYNKIDNQVFLFSKKHAKYPLNFDTVTTYVNATFASTETKVRAYYTWIALNIYYDMGRMQEILDSKRFGLRNFESTTQLPDTVLVRKFAVCEGFSRVMDKLCKASNIPAHLVVGYTKTSNGEVVEDIMHAWNAVKIDSAWGLVDITWSNGYVDNLGIYNKRFSDKYFLNSPKEFLKDHLPLDPMWQLLVNPVSKKHFMLRDSSDENKTIKFNFNDSIADYLKLSGDEQKYADYLHYRYFDATNKETDRILDVFTYNKVVDMYNTAALENEEFTLFFSSMLSKAKTVANCKKARAMLESAKLHLTRGLELVKSKKAFTKEYETTFIEMKEEGAKNIKIVNENLVHLAGFQKTIAPAKRK